MWHPFEPYRGPRPPLTKCIVTLGLMTVALITILKPELSSHYGVTALAFVINLVWIWR